MENSLTNSERRVGIISWALYDWANSAFATVVLAGFFPIFFKQFWAPQFDTTESTFLLGTANSIASLSIVLIAPLVGAMADHLERRKAFLMTFTALGVVMTGGLYWAGEGEWFLAILLFVGGFLGFAGGNLFYDSLLAFVAKPEHLDRVSALGFGLGYLGGGLLFSINIWMTFSPETFHFADKAEAVRFSFLCVAVWWALFAIPLFLFVSEPRKKKRQFSKKSLSGGFRQLIQTYHQARALKHTFLFLLAYWLYIDGVDTIIRMAVDFGMSIGFKPESLIIALLITQFVGFPAAIFYGYLGEKIGAKSGILVAIVIYIGITIYATQMDKAWEFYFLAIMIGLVQGGIQSLSRSLYTRIIPKHQTAEFFGFYNMMGKFAAVIGPFFVGWLTIITNSNRIGLLAVVVLLVLGGMLFWRVDVEQAEKAVQNDLEK